MSLCCLALPSVSAGCARAALGQGEHLTVIHGLDLSELLLSALSVPLYECPSTPGAFSRHSGHWRSNAPSHRSDRGCSLPYCGFYFMHGGISDKRKEWLKQSKKAELCNVEGAGTPLEWWWGKGVRYRSLEGSEKGNHVGKWWTAFLETSRYSRGA